MAQPQLQRPTDEPIDWDILNNPAQSVGHLLRDRVTGTPDLVAFRFPEGDDWAVRTWGEAGREVWQFAAGLIDLGIGAQDRVAIAAATSYQWIVADLGIMAAGAATTTIYPTTIPDDVGYIIANSGSRVVIAQDAEQVDKVRQVRDSIPDVMKVVVLEGDGGGDDDGWVITLEELERRGATLLEAKPDVVDARIDALGPDDLATIIYTSGTTGRPKGVRLLHRTWTFQCASQASLSTLSEADLQYLWLPLSHVFGKLLVILPLQIGFETAVDGRIDKIVENLAVVRPTFMAAAPRIFEKAYGRVTLGIQQEGGVKEKLFNWATGVGARAATLRAEGKDPSGVLALQHSLADKLVLSKVRDRFGGRIRFFISGSAALNPEVARWFEGAGLTILEGYGLTETSAAATLVRPSALRIGAVGWPVPGTEATIAEDGEVLVRGAHVMQGYHDNPEATAEVLTEDGWFHTGDIGEIDARGFVKITDRKKDLFKTSNGKYVAPSIIESRFKGLCPYVSQFVVHGEGRNFVTALVTLDEEAIAPWAEANGLGGRPYAEVVGSAQARDMVQSYVDQLNEGLNRWEQIKKFTILGRDLTVEEGELTPSLKLRRKVVSERFRDDLDGLYG
ncbi:AMP-dependent synthetase/ligase [Janibacter sp. G56]|uniref:AMP-dependent synthetase/ligase n=1 Tax=Janibacter sp. G56 TaxID=3418717 RepID=UPI003CFC88B4